MAEDLVPLALAISPSGAVHLDARPSLEGCAPAALARELTSDLAHGPGFAIVQLAARHPGETLPPSVAFFRDVGALFLARACASPEPASVQAPADELARLVSQAPPMCGGEYLRPSTLEALWSDLDAALRSELRETSLEQWFKDRLDAVVHVDQPVPPLVVEGVPAHVHLSDEAVEVGHPVRVGPLRVEEVRVETRISPRSVAASRFIPIYALRGPLLYPAELQARRRDYGSQLP